MGMTITEKLLARASGKKKVSPDDIIFANVDVAMSHDTTTPLAIKPFHEITKKVFDKRKVVIVFDHVVPPANIQSTHLQKKIRKFVKEQEIENLCMEGVCHQILAERFVSPGDIVIGADSHTCTAGALGVFATGVGSTDIAAIYATGKIWLRVPESLKFNITGNLPKGVFAKDVILHIVGEMGADGATYKAIEFSGNVVRGFSVSSRLTLSNMVIEMGAKNGIIEADEKTMKFTNRRGEISKSDKDAEYENIKEFNISNLEPQVSCPHNVDNVKNINEVEGKEIQQAFIGTCTNGRIEDLAIVVNILKGKRIARNVRLIVSPASNKVYLEALRFI